MMVSKTADEKLKTHEELKELYQAFKRLFGSLSLPKTVTRYSEMFEAEGFDFCFRLEKTKHATELREYYRTTVYFTGKKWYEVNLSDFSKNYPPEYDCLPFMTDEGFKYYLFSFIKICLLEYEECDTLVEDCDTLVDRTFCAMSPSQSSRSYAMLNNFRNEMNREQRAVIIKFLEYSAKIYIDRGEVYGNYPLYALRELWGGGIYEMDREKLTRQQELRELYREFKRLFGSLSLPKTVTRYSEMFEAGEFDILEKTNPCIKLDEEYYTTAYFTGKKWYEVNYYDFAYSGALLIFTTDEGFKYYLFSYIKMCLLEYEYCDMVKWDTFYAMAPSQSSRSYAVLNSLKNEMSREQRAVIIKFLEYFAKIYMDSGESYDDNNHPLHALRELWGSDIYEMDYSQWKIDCVWYK